MCAVELELEGRVGGGESNGGQKTGEHSIIERN